MANKITLVGGLTWTNGSDSLGAKISLAITQAGNAALESVQQIGTSAEAIAIGDVSTIGYLLLKNLDETNYISIGAENTAVGPELCRLLAGEAVILPTRNTTWWAKANTAECDMVVLVVEL